MHANRKRVTTLQVMVGLLVPLFAGSANVYAQCPKRCQGNTDDNGRLCTIGLDCSSGICQAPSQCVHLEWRPQQQDVSPGGIVEIGLYAVSSSGFNQVIEPGMDVVLFWDATAIELLDTIDACRTCDINSINQGQLCDDDSDCTGGACSQPDSCFACPVNTYNWFSSGFFTDCNTSCLNFPCTGSPDNDDDALFTAFSQITCGAGDPIPALATPQGLRVTTFQFRVLSTGGITLVDIPEEGAGQTCPDPVQVPRTTVTRILGGDVPGVTILGVVGPPAQINVVPNCLPPTVEAAGCRYLNVTPSAELSDPVALLVTGDANDPAVSCVSQYVQIDGLLGNTPFYQTPALWGTVAVRGASIYPLKTYSIRADCDGSVPGSVLSEPASDTTWKWGDVNHDGTANIADILRVVDGWLGIFVRLATTCVDDTQCQDPILNFPFFQCNTGLGFCVSATIESLDLLNPNPNTFGCAPDHSVNISDVLRDVDAFLGFTIPCSAPCP